MSTTIEQTALAVIPASAISTIIAADKDDVLGKLAEELKGFKADVTTPTGRKEIASKARKVAVAKMDLLRLKDSVLEDARKTVKAVNAEAKIIEERMDGLRDQIRQPLTEFENAEKARVEAHEAALNAISAHLAFADEPTSAEIERRIADLHAMPERDWQEFSRRAQDEFSATDERLHGKLAQARQREAEKAELERLRLQAEEHARQEAERQRKEHEAEIARQAAEKARREAEAEAERQRLAMLQAAAEEKARVERERLAAEQREQEAIEAKRQAELAAQAAAEKAEHDRIAAQEAAKRREEDMARKAEADRVAAIEAERARVAAEEAARKREEERRAANVAHKRRINGEVLADIMKAAPDLAEGTAVEIVKAIARGLVRHASISY